MKILPFRGIRYNIDPDCVTSPPYDMVSPTDRIYFHNRHPKNVIRLIFGQELPDDTPDDNRFTRAGAYLFEWLAEGTLVQDPNPAVYVYEQHFTLQGIPRTVRGFVSLVKLHDYSERVILPHENTLARPKSDLAKLIRAVDANLDSVYALYPDPEHAVDMILERAASKPPIEEAVDRQNVRHRLWIIEDKEDIEAIACTLKDRQAVIADGHHRYETSLAYRDEMRANDGNPIGDRPYDYVMMTLVNVDTPDLAVLPTHRMARNLPADAMDNLEARLSELFELIPSTKGLLAADMEAHEGKPIGVYQPGKAYLAVLKDQAGRMRLDVPILHDVIFEKLLGIDSERLRQEANVSYTRDASEAITAVDNSECRIAFILNPVEKEAILSMAQAGRKMPQKSTYFFPKLLSGLIMRKIEW